MIDFETKKVLFIDLDGTLIKTISGKTFPEDITDFRIQLPVLDKIKETFPNLSYFFIVTNQGGIGYYENIWNKRQITNIIGVGRGINYDVINTQSGKIKYLYSIDTSWVFGRPYICFYFKK